MSDGEPLVIFAAHRPPAQPAAGLEDRVKRFLERDANTESLDAPAFDKINGSSAKADYLLGNRHFIAELKTLNGKSQ